MSCSSVSMSKTIGSVAGRMGIGTLGARPPRLKSSSIV